MIRDNVSGGSFGECTPSAIVVGPTRELVTQIHREALKFSHSTIMKAALVYGGTSVGYQASKLEQGANIVIGTPGRLLDFIGKGKVSKSV